MINVVPPHQASFQWFVDLEAKTCYKEIKKIDFYMEKGLRWEDLPQFVKDEAHLLRWKHLCVPSIPMLVELVHELYANFYLDRVGHTMVWDVEIDWFPKWINKMLKLPNMSDDDFKERVQEPSLSELDDAL